LGCRNSEPNTREKSLRNCDGESAQPVRQIFGGPYFFPESDGPKISNGDVADDGAFSILSIACCMVMKFTLRRSNEKLRREGEEEGKLFVLFTL